MARVLILGKGGSGCAARALAEKGGAATEAVEGFDLVVASPGIRVMSELEYGCRELHRRGVKLIAITGSKGKSSVVKLIAETLSRAGHSAIACGNYGLAVSEVAAREELPEWAVVEVSSFMMETTNLPPDFFETAAVVNLQEDHLDRHGSVELYHALKRRLLAAARTGFEGGGGPSADEHALFAGSYFDNAVLGENAACAVKVMRAAGLEDAAIASGFAAFSPLPHRFERVGVFGGVECIDDSKATSIAALVAGLEMAGEKVRLIAGGLAKGDDPKMAITPLTKRVKKVYLIGSCAELFSSVWSAHVDCEICGTLERAVEAAMHDAAVGEKVLLSPGTASFDQFKSFGQRGEVFAELVKKEGQKRK